MNVCDKTKEKEGSKSQSRSKSKSWSWRQAEIERQSFLLSVQPAARLGGALSLTQTKR